MAHKQFDALMTSILSLFRSSPLLFFLFVFCIQGVNAQDDASMAPVSESYAITGATVVVSPGQELPKGTVLVNKGLITAVGRDIKIPSDAIIIKADSMYVYAGFIDGFSHVGVMPSKNEKTEKLKYPGNPPPERAGITPQVDVRNLINPSDPSIKTLRNQGFTVAQVAPRGNMLPGQSSIILLGGNTVDEMVLTSQSSMYSELTGTPGVYPSTIMGVMAKWRELYRQARMHKDYSLLYKANPQGLERPVSNQVLEAFYPVIEGKQPVMIKTDKIMDIQRAISLKNDLGYRLILGDLKEGWPILDKIRNSTNGVYLSLSLPDDKKSKVDSVASAERKELEKRKAEIITKHDSQPAIFNKSGIRFGFSTNSVQPQDIQNNLRRMVAAGLSENDALAALTTIPAQLMGLSNRLGTIEKGKLANLVLSDKPYFADKAKVKKVFVEGNLYSVEDKPAVTNGKKAEIQGNWSYTTETPQGKGGGKLVIKERSGVYTGTITNNFSGQETDVKDILLSGNSLSFSYTIDVSGSSLKIEVSALVNGNSFEGSMTAGQYGTFPMMATKNPN